MSSHVGWDSLCLEPSDKEQNISCRVCNERMTATLGQFGPTSWVGAMGGHKNKHDLYVCPHTEEDWHKQALAIKMAAKKTPSKKLEVMLLEEAEEIVNTKIATKTPLSFSIMA